MWQKFRTYIISVLVALGVGALSAFVTRGNMDIYDTIITPPLSPPMWVFPVVWSVLYVLMGVGSAMIYKSGEQCLTEGALSIYAIQLVVNFFWSIIFFNMRAYLFAFVWLIVLWLLITAMIYAFSKINRKAAFLQIPYLLWVSFAGYLTFMIYILNR